MDSPQPDIPESGSHESWREEDDILRIHNICVQAFEAYLYLNIWAYRNLNGINAYTYIYIYMHV